MKNERRKIMHPITDIDRTVPEIQSFESSGNINTKANTTPRMDMIKEVAKCFFQNISAALFIISLL